MCMWQFNCSFADNYYFMEAGRSSLLENFSKNELRLLSNEVPECIDHIAVTSKFVGKSTM